MANVFYVLTLAKNNNKEAIIAKPENTQQRDSLCKEIFCQVQEALQEYLRSEIEYIIDDVKPEHYILGVENPETIIKEAEKWNRRILRNYQHTFEYFDQKRSELQCDSLIELFTKLEASPNLEYQVRRYEFRRALCDLDNRILYGTSYIVVDYSEDYASCDTKVSEDFLEQVKTHPENAAMIEVYYN